MNMKETQDTHEWAMQAGLVLSAMAAFLTTPPPVKLINYNLRFPYILIFVSFCLSLGGLIVGSTHLYVLTKMERPWFRKVRLNS